MTGLTSELTLEALPNLPEKPDISHIPGEDGLPIIGTTFKVLRDPQGYTEHMHKIHGPVYRSYTLGQHTVTLLGPEANELVLFDKGKTFSSELGWTPTLKRLFPRGLMLLDFEVHRGHRKTMQAAFKTSAMRSYIESLNEGIKARLKDWTKTPEFKFYPAIKDLTLNLAASPFLGIPWGPEADKINKSFVDMVAATIAPIRVPLPGTQMAKGVKGRKYMCAYFAQEIPKRRGSDAQDMFTILCNAKDDDGNGFSDQEIIDHMNFLMMAAHDTITSSVTSMVYELAKHPEWQEKLRTEMQALEQDGYFPYDKLNDVPLTEMAFKEVLRLHAPVPALPRRAIRDFEFKGHKIPAGTMVGLNPLFTHRMEDVWPDPDKFDPMRFTTEETAKRHKYAWIPFGGGAHMCLGLHFAYMQAKVFFYHLLTTHKVELEANYKPSWRPWPIYKPGDGLPIRLSPLKS
ncbi:MAG: cytochrome P450 [Sphingomonadales bacterium]|jgi:cytochrome P450